MKRLLCLIMAGFIMLAFSGCGKSAKESRFISGQDEKTDGDIELGEDVFTTPYKTEPSETTKTPYVQAHPNDTFEVFERVTTKVFAALGDGYDNLEYMSAQFVDQNKSVGIINMAHIWRGDFKIKEDNTPDRHLKVEILIFEFDTESEQYKKIKLGKDIEFYADYNNIPSAVTAVNGQYVICCFASEGRDQVTADIVETYPTFTLGNVQKGYDAFMKIDPTKTNQTSYDTEEDVDALKKFEQLVDKVHVSLGVDDYMNREYQSNANAKLNRELGIKNMAHIWRSESDLEGDRIIWEFNVNVWIFEFDTESAEYKDLKVGDQMFFYDREYMDSATVTAINGKYVICILAVDQDFKINRITTEIGPKFTLGNAQKGYETFIAFK